MLDGEKLGQRRFRSLIVTEMLRIAGKGVSKCQLMYKAHLNSTQLEVYLEMLLRNKLLQVLEIGGNQIYETTLRGKQYIQEFETIREILDNSDS